MKKTLLYSVVFLVVISALGISLYLLNKEPEAEESSTEEQIAILPASGTPSYIEVLHPDEESYLVIFGEENGITTYELSGFTEDVPLDMTRLDTLYGSVAGLWANQVLEQGTEPSGDYGLNPPAATINFSYSDGTTYQVLLGDTVPSLGTYCYYDGTLSLINSDVAASLSSRKYDYVNHSIVSLYEDLGIYQPDTVTLGGTVREEDIRIQRLAAQSEDAYLYYNATAAYEIQSPINGALDSTASQNLSSVMSLAADGIYTVDPMEEELTELGFDEPYSTIGVMADGTAFTLYTVRREPDQILLRRDRVPVIYIVNAERIPWLEYQAAEILSKTAYNPKLDDLSRIVLSSADATYTFDLSKEDDNLIVTLNGTQVNASVFRTLYREMTAISMETPAEPPTEGTQPSVTIRYTFVGGAHPDAVVELVPGSARRVHVVVDGVDTGYETLASYGDQLLTDSQDLLTQAGE